MRSAYELTPDAFDGLEANPLWPTLEAVQQGAVVDTAVLLVNFGGPMIALECARLVNSIYERAATLT